MKTISSPAMAAIEAGEVIVTGAVEIIPAAVVFVPAVPTDTNSIVLTWWQISLVQVPPDEGRMGLAFYDTSGVHLGTTVWSPYAAPASWTQYTLTETAPGGTAFVRVYQDHLRHSGSSNDSFIDDIVLTVGGAPVTLVNPGAETGGGVGWISLAGAGVFSASPGHTGATAFASTEAHTVVYQDVDVTVDPAEPPPPPGDTVRLWGGYGPIELDGETYQGVGDRALAQQTNGALGAVAQGLTIGLSGIEPVALELMDVVGIRGASVVLRRLIFATDGRTLLDYAVWDRGRVDVPNMEETVGGTATVSLAVESAARGLGHSGARQRSDNDQRLISTTDGYFKNTAYAGQKTLFWGGKKPAIGGVSGGGGGITISGVSAG